jgi:hypothetical protein
MKLDDVIYKDIRELLECGEISAAVALCPVMKSGLNSSDGFSAKGLPQYFTGDRKGKTVMVNLNPGMDAKKADQQLDDMKQSFSTYSADEFIEYLLDRHTNFGLYDIDKNNPGKLRYDEFDVKQAAFLTPWKNSGIDLPENPDWSDRDACIDAKTKVICNKYQLELVPYASSKFAINPKEIHLFRPHVDVLLDEIFSQPREYVIFASAIFEKIFKDYNKAYPGTFDLSRPVVYGDVLKEGGSLRGKCKVITMTYKGKTRKAMIAHTFPSQALCRAFALMQKYGKFCYLEYIK